MEERRKQLRQSQQTHRDKAKAKREEETRVARVARVAEEAAEAKREKARDRQKKSRLKKSRLKKSRLKKSQSTTTTTMEPSTINTNPPTAAERAALLELARIHASQADRILDQMDREQDIQGDIVAQNGEIVAQNGEIVAQNNRISAHNVRNQDQRYQLLDRMAETNQGFAALDPFPAAAGPNYDEYPAEDIDVPSEEEEEEEPPSAEKKNGPSAQEEEPPAAGKENVAASVNAIVPFVPPKKYAPKREVQQLKSNVTFDSPAKKEDGTIPRTTRSSARKAPRGAI